MRILTSPRKRNALLSTRTLETSATREDDRIEKWASTKDKCINNVGLQEFSTLLPTPTHTKYTEGTDQFDMPESLEMIRVLVCLIPQD